MDIDWQAVSLIAGIGVAIYLPVTAAVATAGAINRSRTARQIVEGVGALITRRESEMAKRQADAIDRAMHDAKRQANNPFGHAWNLTAQSLLLRDNAALAYELAAEAGVTIGTRPAPAPLPPAADQLDTFEPVDLPPAYFPNQPHAVALAPGDDSAWQDAHRGERA